MGCWSPAVDAGGYRQNEEVGRVATLFCARHQQLVPFLELLAVPAVWSGGPAGMQSFWSSRSEEL